MNNLQLAMYDVFSMGSEIFYDFPNDYKTELTVSEEQFIEDFSLIKAELYFKLKRNSLLEYRNTREEKLCDLYFRYLRGDINKVVYLNVINKYEDCEIKAILENNQDKKDISWLVMNEVKIG